MTSYIYNMVDTWNDGATTFTAVKMNVTDTASNAASRLLDLQVGGSSRFNVDKAGIAYSSLGFGYCAGNLPAFSTQYAQLGSATNLGLGLSSSSPINWYPNTPISGAADTILTRRGTANLRLGAADAAAPVAQTLSVQSVVAGTSNTAGANLTITGSQGTGLGAGGSIIFQVAPAGLTGTAQNALATALTIASDRKITFADAGAQAYIDKDGKASFYSGRFTAGSGFASPWVTIADNTLGINFNDAAYLSWCNNSNASSGTADVRLYRDAANTLALRNGAAAQLFRVYRTTDGTNASWLEIDANANGNAYIGTNKTGTGAAGPLYFLTGGTARWQVDVNGHFLAGTDNLYDIGASGATRPRNIYAAGNGIFGGASDNTLVVAGGGANAAFAWVGKTLIYGAETDGNIRLSNNAGNNFGRLQFGGTTSAFPALKRSSTTLQARLADDSAFASVQGKLTTDTAYTAGAPTATGYLVVYDSNGTAYRIPAVLN